jgi:Fe2+ or Zn2+ uptake regulation protein
VTDGRQYSLRAYIALGSARGLGWPRAAIRILAILWRSTVPLGAYAIRDLLASKGRSVHVNTVYRSLAGMIDAQLVVAVASSKKYYLSPDPWAEGWLTLICTQCGRVTAVSWQRGSSLLSALASAMKFSADRMYFEASGRCIRCSKGTGL